MVFDYLNDKIYTVLDMTFIVVFNLQREWKQIKLSWKADLECFLSYHDLVHLHISRIWRIFLEEKVFFFALPLHF